MEPDSFRTNREHTYQDSRVRANREMFYICKVSRSARVDNKRLARYFVLRVVSIQFIGVKGLESAFIDCFLKQFWQIVLW